MISPAPIPCRKRKNSSQPKLGAAAHNRQATTLHRSPARNTRPLAPMSPTRPNASISRGMGQDIADDDPWIIGIGSPKLRVMSGKAILTAGSKRHDGDAEPHQHQPEPRPGRLRARRWRWPFTAGAILSQLVGERGSRHAGNRLPVVGCSAYRRGGAGGMLASGDVGREIFGAAMQEMKRFSLRP